jgi:predicted lysophospholipase L1 biosynthesis ABC-type transport system permease subunit
VIDENLARKLWPGQDPLGKRIQFGGGKPGAKPEVIEVVGVAPDIRESLVGSELSPHVFVPFGQAYQSNMNIHLRTLVRGPEAENALRHTVRREIRSFDERLPVLGLETLRGHLEGSIEMWTVRTGAWLFTILGSVALFLAIVGVCGVRAYTVARRTREIGIRMALGATALEVLRLVLREGIALTLTGVLLGLPLALAAGKLLGSILYEVSGTDLLVLSTSSTVLALISVAACYLPARRAALVEPTTALRYE